MKIRQNNTWIELSRARYGQNIKYLRNIIGPNTKYAVLLKANAYGHGLAQIARLAHENRVDMFCVFTMEEAITLREENYKNEILVLGPVHNQCFIEALENDIQIVVYDAQNLYELSAVTAKMGKAFKIHLKLETGFNRQGLNENDLREFIEVLNKSSSLKLVGISTHFSTGDEPKHPEYLYMQLKRFNEMLNTIGREGHTELICHTANSAAALLFPGTRMDLVRLGITPFGLWPSSETESKCNSEHEELMEKGLQPILSWYTKICQIKNVTKGEAIGYGRSYYADKDMVVGILPVGYSDGLARSLSNRCDVLVRGKRARICGRISMNLTAIDLTKVPEAELFEKVVIIGKDGAECITAEDHAELIGTINYEVLTGINSSIQRIIV